MPRDANGVYSLPPGYVAVANTPILTSQHNPILEDVATEITGSLPRSGAAPMTGPLKLQAGAPTLAEEATRKDYVDNNFSNSVAIGGTSTGAANAQVLAALAPSGFTPAAGKRIVFWPGFTNTGATTLQITVPAVAATNIFKMSPAGEVPLSGGELVAGQPVELLHDGTQYLLLNNAVTQPGKPVSISANTTFTASDLGKFIEITGSTGITATLPTPVVPSGGGFTVWNNSTVAQTLSTPAGTFAGPGGSAASTLSLLVGETAILSSDGANWIVMFRYPPKVRVTVPVRQTVLSGPRDSNGFPTFFPATSVNLTLTMQNVSGSAPIVAAIAQGFDGSGQLDLAVTITTNLPITLPASSTSYIWLDDTGALGSTTLAPIYQEGGTASVTNGQHTYIIGQGQMYVGNGSAASAVNRVFIGEAVTSGAAVTSTVAYAYQGKYVSPNQSNPGTGNLLSVNSNIGVQPRSVYPVIVFLTATGGYSIGDEVAFPSLVGSASQQGTYFGATPKTAFCGFFIASLSVPTKNAASFTAVSGANFNIKFYVNRGW